MVSTIQRMMKFIIHEEEVEGSIEGGALQRLRTPQVDIYLPFSRSPRHASTSSTSESDNVQHLVELTRRIDSAMQTIIDLESKLLNKHQTIRNHPLRVL